MLICTTTRKCAGHDVCFSCPARGIYEGIFSPGLPLSGTSVSPALCQWEAHRKCGAGAGFAFCGDRSFVGMDDGEARAAAVAFEGGVGRINAIKALEDMREMPGWTANVSVDEA